MSVSLSSYSFVQSAITVLQQTYLKLQILAQAVCRALNHIHDNKILTPGVAVNNCFRMCASVKRTKRNRTLSLNVKNGTIINNWWIGWVEVDWGEGVGGGWRGSSSLPVSQLQAAASSDHWPRTSGFYFLQVPEPQVPHWHNPVY